MSSLNPLRAPQQVRATSQLTMGGIKSSSTRLPAVGGTNQSVALIRMEQQMSSDPYQFLTPQKKMPMRHQLLNSINKNSFE
jgi:hypothetical protein